MHAGCACWAHCCLPAAACSLQSVLSERSLKVLASRASLLSSTTYNRASVITCLVSAFSKYSRCGITREFGKRRSNSGVLGRIKTGMCTTLARLCVTGQHPLPALGKVTRVCRTQSSRCPLSLISAQREFLRNLLLTPGDSVCSALWPSRFSIPHYLSHSLAP